MRQYYKILLLLLMIIGCWACSSDGLLNSSNNDNQPVIILISADSRANNGTEHAGDAADRAISSLRVLVYESASGDLAFNIPVPTISDPIQLNIKTGRYDFVFIANEGSDNALATQLAALTPGVDRVSGLYSMSFAASAFAADKAIPMVTYISDVIIINNEQYQTPDMQAPQTGVWPVLMERLGVRLDVALQMSQSQYNRFSANKMVRFANVPDRVYLAPAIVNNGTVLPAEVTIPTGDITITPIVNPTDAYVWEMQCKRVILPENTFLDKTDASKAFKLILGFGTDDTAETIIGLEPPANHGIPRNTYLEMDGKVLSTSFTVNATVLDWNGQNVNNTWDETHTFQITDRSLTLDPTGQADAITILSSISDLSLGNFSSGNWTESTSGTWTDGHFTVVLAANQGGYTVTATANANTLNQPERNITFDVLGGAITIQVTLKQEAVLFNASLESGKKESILIKEGAPGMFSGTYPIYIESNIEWDVTLDADGVTLDPNVLLGTSSGGSGNTVLDFNYQPVENNEASKSYTINFKNTALGVNENLSVVFLVGATRGIPNILAVDNKGILNLDGRGWTVFFKWGSTIATIRDVFEGFSANHVVWTPYAYNKTTLINSINQATTIKDKWDCIPYAVHGTYTTMPDNTPTLGLGDPCSLAMKDNFPATNYRMAKRNYSGYMEQFTNGRWENASIYGVSGYWSDYGGTDSQFFPHVTRRLPSGVMDEGSSSTFFWMSALVGNGSAYCMSITSPSGSPYHAARQTLETGIPIRCVKD